MEDFFVSSYGTPTFVALVLWSTIWKGLALWRAAKKDNKAWFVVLLVVNTVGILEIIYLYLISPVKSGQDSK
jgi:hypothetical protein